VRKILAISLAVLGAVAALTFITDYLVLRVRLAAKTTTYGSVNVQSYYAIPHKNGKTEFDFQPPQSQTCVHSLLPHMGFSPCWYLVKHSEQQIKV
jgi:hypothetical protein